jgi:nitrate/nitrite-specific signal transduction histidine kinase
MAKVEAGDLGAQAAVASHDEIGEIARVFNRMSAENATMVRELSQVNRKLEEKVAERSEELQEATRRLGEAKGEAADPSRQR